MLKSSTIFVSIVFINCWLESSAQSTAGALTCSVKCKIPEGYFADDKDPAIYYECTNGVCMGAWRCANGMIFDDLDHTCMPKSEPAGFKCPPEGGIFPYPEDIHKFIQCSDGHAYIFNCTGTLIFDPNSKTCVFGVNPITMAPTSATVQTSAAPGTNQTIAGQSSAAPLQTTAVTPPVVLLTTGISGDCTRKGFYKDPTDMHRYHVCRDGKELTVHCPVDMVFDEQLGSCA